MKHLRQFHQFLPGEVHATKEDFVLGDFKVPLEKQKIVLDRGSDNGTHLSYKFGGGSFCRAIEGGRFVHLRVLFSTEMHFIDPGSFFAIQERCLIDWWR